jgi:hypothetical protein
VVVANGNILSGSIETGEGSIDLITTGGSGTWSARYAEPQVLLVEHQGQVDFLDQVGHQDLMEHQGQVDHQVLMETSSDQGSSGVNGSSGSAGSSGINGVIGSNYISTTKIGIDALISSNGLKQVLL